MTSIKLTRNLGGHSAGDTIDVTPGIAAHLTDAGVAEEVKPARKTATKSKADEPTDD